MKTAVKPVAAALVMGVETADPIDYLRPPPAAVAAASSPAPAFGDDRLAARLAQTFRSTFGLPPSADVSSLALDNVEHRGSLGRLKLMMEVEQTLRVRLPAGTLAPIRARGHRKGRPGKPARQIRTLK